MAPTNKSFLSERTFLPISFVVTLLCFAAWITSVAVRAENTRESLNSHLSSAVERVEKRDAAILDIQRRLERLDAKVDVIYETVRKHR